MQSRRAGVRALLMSLFSLVACGVLNTQTAFAQNDASPPPADVNKRLTDLESQLKMQHKLLMDSRSAIGTIQYQMRQLLNENHPSKKAKVGTPFVRKNAKVWTPRKSAKASVQHAQSADVSTFELPGQATTSARKVHFLIYSYADDDAIGEGAQANEKFLLALANKFDSFEANRVTINGSRLFTENSITNDIAALPDVQPEDAIFCYMSTHGTYSPTVGHSVLMTDGRTVVPRSNIFKILKSRNTRLTVFITDSCANFAPGTAGFPTASTNQTVVATYPLHQLLYSFVGNLNMNGASPDPTHVNGDGSQGEEGFYLTNSSNRGGGIATRAFIKEAVFGSSQDWVQFYTNWLEGTQTEGQFGSTPLQTPAVFNENGIWIH